jgi:hypothetical protein
MTLTRIDTTATARSIWINPPKVKERIVEISQTKIKIIAVVYIIDSLDKIKFFKYFLK